jgi:O-antigen/teichoic acid export membrane protein
VFVFKPSNVLFWILYSYPLSVLIALALSSGPAIYFYAKKLGGVRPECTPEMRASLFRQIKFGVFANPLKALMDVSPLWLLKRFTSIEAVGIYNAAIMLVRVIQSFVRALETTILPIISQFHAESLEKRRFFMLRMTKYSLWIVLLCMVAMAAGVPWVIKFTVKLDYLQAVPYFRVAMLMLIGLVYVQVERPLLYAIERQDALIYTDIVIISLIFLAGPPLLHFFGLWGMIAVNIADKFITSAMYCFFIKQKERDFRLLENPFRIDDWDRKIFRSIISFGRK